MSVAQILRAKHVGIRDLKDRLSEHLGTGKPIVATDRGTPKYFLVPYEEMVELVEVLEEANDPAFVAKVEEARAAYRRGEWVPADRLWARLDRRRSGRTRR